MTRTTGTELNLMVDESKQTLFHQHLILQTPYYTHTFNNAAYSALHQIQLPPISGYIVSYSSKLSWQKIFVTLNGITKKIFTNIQSHEARMKKYSQLHESFYHEIFILEQNSRNYRSFLPRKFGAIQYTFSHFNIQCRNPLTYKD